MATLVRLRNMLTKSVVNVSEETAAALGPEWKREAKKAAPKSTPKKAGDTPADTADDTK